MRISQAGIRSARPVTRFVSPAMGSRESHLGLRRGVPRLSPAGSRTPSAATLDTLRNAARSLSTRGRGTTNRAVAVTDLRRADAVIWSQPTHSGTRRPRPRSAAPWRG